ncbi:MAG: YicC family protein [Gammaproteobacteria bacterium]|nr:MAG: YicC family protein [Gammaproteobacteria bacterium]
MPPLSMTAFARAERDSAWGGLSWEIRSVNHRHLELAPRLPETLRSLEPAMRACVGKHLSRGKVDLSLRFAAKSDNGESVQLDEAVIDRLLQLATQISGKSATLTPLSVAEVLRWPDALKAPEIDIEALSGVALELLSEGLEELVANRRREGVKLKEMISQRIAAMRAVVETLIPVLPEVMVNFRERLQQRLAQVQDQVNAERLEQEIVIFAQKIDVDEELDRLTTHLDEVERVLDQGGPVGRRLDFLMQELNREANTLGSKAADIRVTNAAVELKVLIEQMREQIQNIE